LLFSQFDDCPFKLAAARRVAEVVRLQNQNSYEFCYTPKSSAGKALGGLKSSALPTARLLRLWCHVFSRADSIQCPLSAGVWEMINQQEIQGHWNELRGKVKEKWGQLTDQDLQIVGGNVDQVIGRIQQKTGTAREEIENFLSHAMETPTGERVRQVARDVGERAREGYEQVRQRAQEGYEQVRGRAQEGYEQAGHMFEEHTTASVATIFGLGVLAGAIVGMMCSSSD
jgi:uncharacterized protein YjbJ (UPF0337 family)